MMKPCMPTKRVWSTQNKLRSQPQSNCVSQNHLLKNSHYASATWKDVDISHTWISGSEFSEKGIKIKALKKHQALLRIWLSTALTTIMTPIKQSLDGRSQQTLAEINFQQHRHLLATQYLKLNEVIKRRFTFKMLYISCVRQRRFFRINIAQKISTVV